jgi:methylmalonyl-CoA/ethylmalonyl-CoA epimerase
MAMRLLSRLHHVGIACRDLERVREWVHLTHPVAWDSGIVHDPLQRADLCLLQFEQGPAIELVAGPMVAGVVKRGHSYYHVCYSVSDIDAATTDLEKTGCRRVSDPVPAVLFGGSRVVFLLGPTGLVELLEN